MEASSPGDSSHPAQETPILNATSVPAAASQLPSPVTWHVIIWILFTLALNSMVQPAGTILEITLPERLRIYMCSSPLICFSDALSVLISVSWTHYALRVPWSKAARLHVLKRHAVDSFQPISEIEHVEYAKQRGLPRSVLFVIGVLPATIKLCAFSGVPWTQTWGLIFVCSSIVFEGLDWLAKLAATHSPVSISEVMEMDVMHWKSVEQEPLRRKMDDHFSRQRDFHIVLVMGTYIAQCFLTLFTVLSIWQHSKPAIALRLISAIGNEIILWISLVSFMSMLLVTVFWLFDVGLFSSLCAGKSFRRSFPFCWLWKFWLFAMSIELAPSLVVRNEKSWSRLQSASLIASMDILYPLASVLLILCYSLLAVIRMFPGLGRFLLILNKHDPTIKSSDNDQRHPAQPHIEPSIEGTIVLVFFCLNLATTPLWYGLVYDSSETTNPPWIDVFGK
jgi:hypothetical protein